MTADATALTTHVDAHADAHATQQARIDLLVEIRTADQPARISAAAAWTALMMPW